MTTQLTYGLRGIGDSWPWTAVVAERLKLTALTPNDGTATRQNEIALGFTSDCLYWYLWRVDAAFAEAILISTVTDDSGGLPVVCCFDTGAAVTYGSDGHPLIWSSGQTPPDLVQSSSLNWQGSEQAFYAWIEANYPDLPEYMTHRDPTQSHCAISIGPETDSRWSSWEARFERSHYPSSGINVDFALLEHDDHETMILWLRQNIDQLDEDAAIDAAMFLTAQGSVDRPFDEARQLLQQMSGATK